MSPLIPLLMLIVKRSWKSHSILNILLFYLILSFSTDLICLSFIVKKYNNVIIDIYATLEVVLILIIYQLNWQKIKSTNLLKVLILLILLLSVLTFFYTHYPWLSVLNNVSRALVIIFVSMIYYFDLIEKYKGPILTDYYFFWLNTAFFVYFSGFLSILLFKNYILSTHSSQQVKSLWNLHNLFHILFNCLLAIGIGKWKAIKT